ncbi:MAG: hypothetical protein ACP5IE_00255 [Infirmifilum sp.]
MNWLLDWLIILISSDPVFAFLIVILLLAIAALFVATLSMLAPLLPGLIIAVAVYLLSRDILLAIVAFLIAEIVWLIASRRHAYSEAIISSSEYLE